MRLVSIVALVCALVGSGAQAAPSWVTMELEATLETSRAATHQYVDVVLRLTTHPDGAEKLPLLALAIADTTIQGVTAHARLPHDAAEAATRPLAVDIERLPLQTVVGLDLPQDGSGSTEPLDITLRYRVANAMQPKSELVVSTLPVLVPRWRPLATTARAFEALVALPPGHTVVRSFPTGGRAENDGVVRLDLPATPSMVRIVSRDGKGAWLTFERSLDILVVAGLLTLGGFGWRAVRRFA